MPGPDSRFQLAGAVFDVFEAALVRELTNAFEVNRGPWAETQLAERAAHVVAAHEADVGREVVAHFQILRLRAIPIAGVFEASEIAVVVVLEAFGVRTSVVGTEVDVLKERERRIGAVSHIANGW